MSAGMDQAMKRLDGPRLARPHVLALALGAALLAAAPATPGPPPQSPSRAALDFHKRALVVDGHVHLINAVFNQGIDPWKPQETGTFDYARAAKGGLDVVVEQLYIEDAYNRYNYTTKQACRLIETFYRVAEMHHDRMELARTSADVRRIVASGKLAVILALEGGFDMEGDLDVLRLFHRLGVRMVQLTNHETTNAMVDGPLRPRWGGLSDHGREVIREMNRLGIVIDISHASDEAKSQIIAASRAPVVTSHNGLRHFAEQLGGLTDATLDALAARGGVMGLHSAGWLIDQKAMEWDRTWHSGQPRREPLPPLVLDPEATDRRFITELDARMRVRWLEQWGYGRPWRKNQQEVVDAGAPLPTVERWAEQVEWVVRRVGPEHIGLGLDLMAGGNWLRDFDATSYPRLTAALQARGLGPEVLHKVLGENWLRVLDAARVDPDRRR